MQESNGSGIHYHCGLADDRGSRAQMCNIGFVAFFLIGKIHIYCSKCIVLQKT
jgi:hypothetical protein